MIVVPGTLIQTEVDTPVGAGATVPLPVVPANTRRMIVQVTDGDENTLVRVREVGGMAGSGYILILYDSRIFGGGDGALANLEVQNMAGPDSAVAVQFERD